MAEPKQQSPTSGYYGYWGKAQNFEQNGKYHLLVHHSLDVAAVAQVILDKHPTLLRVLSHSTGIAVKILKAWILWAIALHDLGKFATDFQSKVPILYRLLQPNGRATSENTHHSDLGFRLFDERIKRQLLEQIDPAARTSQQKEWLNGLLRATTGHHGKPPVKLQSGLFNHFSERAEADAIAFCEAMTNFFGVDLDLLSQIEESHKQALLETSWLIAGLCVLCDWLGSNTDYFVYQQQPTELDEYWQAIALPSAERAVAESGVLPATTSQPTGFSHLFPHITQPTHLQSVCNTIELADGPNFFILEDLTGSGKTEAALTLAGRLVASQKAHGLFVGLPTQATANAMYTRAADVYERFYATGDNPSLTLAHSSQHLQTLFREPISNPPPDEASYSATEETASAHCTSWIADSRKRALLADIGVGTIDQALLGVLHAKHQCLRVYGLLGKVLIIDEVHAYDPYMEGLMSNLIRFHTRYGGHTILLSATLPTAMRAEYISTFAEATGTHTKEIVEAPFPLLTHISAGKQTIEQSIAASQQKVVPVQLLHNPEQPLKILLDAHRKDQSGCWIRNTVDDAITTRQRLLEMGVPEEKCLLLHSRFCLSDRIDHEQKVLKHLGKDSTGEDRKGYIVIGTQVLEQSLDFDADCMVTDLAPIDLLIQRAGRRLRHLRDAQGNRASAEGRPATPLYVLSPRFDEPITEQWCQKTMPGTAAVYRNHALLWKTATLLAERQGWTLPDDARDLIESVYDIERIETPAALMQSEESAKGTALSHRGASNHTGLALTKGYTSNSLWDSEEKAPTRLTEEESETVFLAQWIDGELAPLINAEKYAWDLSSLKLRQSQVPKEHFSKETKSAVDRAKAKTNRLNEYSKVLPLALTENGISLIENNEQVGYDQEHGLFRR